MAVSLFDTLGEPVRDADRRFLADLWRPAGGGVATFSGPGAWGVAHWDVTPWAYLGLAPGDRKRLRQSFLTGLRDNLQDDGLWRTYWWRTPHYATFLTLEALDELELPEPAAAQPRGHGVDNAFDLACALGAQRLRGASRADLGAPLRELLWRQHHDGRWPGHANLRVTDDTCYEPWVEPVGTCYEDDAGTITTATALRALVHFLEPSDRRQRQVA
jgi:hypothetical protein